MKLAPDQATAEYLATSENAQREALHPADEIQDFGAMEKRGATVADIATAYGATEAHVYRRLALATLPCPVIDALRSGDISLSNAAAFTISDDEKLTLEVLENVRGVGESDHRIKKMLKPDAIKDSDRRAIYVGVEAYIEAGGRTSSDLFADEVLIDDPVILDDLFGKKLAETSEGLIAEGWKWAEPINDSYIGWYQIDEMKLARIYAENGDLSEEQGEEYDALAELAESDALDDEGQANLAALAPSRPFPISCVSIWIVLRPAHGNTRPCATQTCCWPFSRSSCLASQATQTFWVCAKPKSPTSRQPKWQATRWMNGLPNQQDPPNLAATWDAASVPTEQKAQNSSWKKSPAISPPC